ncbi:MAG: diguanylate cyclase [Sulfurimonas sp.]|nr:diguanylate cyclase [Sulfurimonas sp.]
MSIKNKLFALLILLFLFFSAFAWFYSTSLNKQLNEDWAERFIEKQILFDKYRTLLPIVHEVALVEELSHDPIIRAMALDEVNSSNVDNGIALLEKYRLKFKDRNYFFAIAGSNKYYFNDIDNSYANKQYRYTLSSENEDDAWFFTLLNTSLEYQINVNEDTLLGTTKVWIDYLIKDKGKTVAIFGTGIDLSEFLKESVDIEQEGVRNLFINSKMAIQLERDGDLIDYASVVDSKKSYKNLDLLIQNKEDLQNIRALMDELKSTSHQTLKTLWIELPEGKKLLGLSYLRELDWYSITIINPKELTLISDINMFLILSFFFLFSLVLVNSIYNKLILHPLKQLHHRINQIEDGTYNKEIVIKGDGEIAALSERFEKLFGAIEENHQELENKIKERTLSLKESEEKLHTILNTIEGFVYIKDTEHKYTYVNKHVCRLFEKSYDEIIGKDDSAFVRTQCVEDIFENDTKVIEKGVSIKEEEVRIDKDNNKKVYLSNKTPLIREDGTIYGLCGISTDITERINMEEKNRHLAFYDHLTDLPNRRLFDDRLHQALASSKRNDFYGCVMFLDLDNFKPLNDTYGHEVGDQLLIEVATRLKSSVRELDTVARFGGDEFIVLINSLCKDKEESKEHALLVAGKISSLLAKTYTLKMSQDAQSMPIEYNCSASIGVVLFKGDKLFKDALILQADEEMYNAKKSGKNSISFFDNQNI